MKALKLAFWIFFMYIAENVFSVLLSLGGTVPNMLLAFVTAYGFCEIRERRGVKTVLICAVLCASGVGRCFEAVLILMVLSGAAAFLINGRVKSMPKIICVTAVAFSASCVTKLCESALDGGFNTGVIIGGVIPHGVYTAAVSVIIYLCLTKTVFKKEDKKLLIINERN